MRKRYVPTYGIFWICLLLISCETSPQKEVPPNILLIISDDQAWGDYSFMGHAHIETPHIDKLAKESLAFTRGYVAAPLCSPSLATIITGLYPHQHGITGNDPLFEFEGKRYSKEWQLQRSALFAKYQAQFYKQTLLTQRLQKQNYLSMQTGKWWLGSWEDGYFTHGMTHGDAAKKGRHGDEGLAIGREGLQPIYNFIEEAQTKDQPFFVWYAPFLPHTPHTPPKELEDKYLSKAPTPAIARYWAMCEWFDQTCGDLINYLEDQQLSENTIVVYVCDNGWIQLPNKNNRYAPRSKRTPYEGGLRTPILLKWPGKIQPALDTTTLVSSIDIVPTILAACQQAPDKTLPGVNLLNEQRLQKRTTIFAEALDHDIQSFTSPTKGLQYRIGLEYPWKLILPDSTNLPTAQKELFNIVADPNEIKNQVKTYPEIVEQLHQKIDDWWTPTHLESSNQN